MKKLFLIFFLSSIGGFPFVVNGQTTYELFYNFKDRNNLNNEESSESSVSTETKNGKTKTLSANYYVNGKRISKYMNDQNRKSFEKLSDRSGIPYRLVTFDLDSVKMSDCLMVGFCYCGFYYEFHANGKLKTRGEYHELTVEELNAKNLIRQDCNPQKVGKWIYYNEMGTELYFEEYVNGEKKQ